MNAQSETRILDITDKDGKIRISGIHDAQLVNFYYISMKKIEFNLKGSNNEYTIIKILNPSILNITSLWEGSIVDFIHAWDVHSVPEKTWNDPQDGWNALLDQRVGSTKRRSDVEQIILKHPGSILLVVSCIYGGQWAVVGEEVAISQVLS